MALFLAHRGASNLAPENTLAAFRLAQNLGVHGFELDIQRCASGELVIFHDSTPYRTTNYRQWLREVGRDVARAKRRYIAQLPWEQLRQLDAGSWKNEQYRGERIARLEDFLPLLSSDEFLVIEVKTYRLRNTGLADDLVKILERFKMKKRPVVVGSFNPMFLKHFRERTRDYPIALISEVRPPPNRSRKIWIPVLKPEVLLLQGHAKVGPQIAAAHRARRKVFLWTLDTAEEYRKALDAKADGVISNRAELLSDLPPDLAARFHR